METPTRNPTSRTRRRDPWQAIGFWHLATIALTTALVGTLWFMLADPAGLRAAHQPPPVAAVDGSPANNGHGTVSSPVAAPAVATTTIAPAPTTTITVRPAPIVTPSPIVPVQPRRWKEPSRVDRPFANGDVAVIEPATTEPWDGPVNRDHGCER